jgi:hypothetical protein
MKRPTSLALSMVAALALAVSPALAQNAPSGGAQGGGTMQGMEMAKPAKKGMKPAGMKTAMKHSCMDYAWQSQDQKDCEAGTKPPPSWH